MSELFGLSMTVIMFILLAVLGLCVVASIITFFAGRVMFRMGVRNIGRRRAQSALVVSGLMLATIIITASFTTGDSLDYSITSITYDTLQRTDISLHHFQSRDASEDGNRFYAHDDLGARLQEAFADDADIEGFVPFLFEPVPAFNARTRLKEATVILAGSNAADLVRFGGLTLVNGDDASVTSLGDDEAYANETAAEKMDIRAGDVITIYVNGEERLVTVAGIVRDERATGSLEFGPGAALPGLAAKLSTVQRLTGHEGEINSVSVVLRGGVRGGLTHSEAAAEKLTAFIATDAGKQQLGLGSAGFQVEQVKKDAVDDAELVGNLFTTIFLVLGLFSIASGVLLIFMIFVMLAAERRQEMGIIRAVGAEQKHLVQAFLAEGIVYDLVAGIAGIVLGVVFAVVIVVGGARLLIGEDFSFIQSHVTVRSLVVSFCLGAVLTFITVVMSSLYVSRLNIVAAIRGRSDSGVREKRQKRSRKWFVIGLLMLPFVAPLGFYWLLRKAFGLPQVWSAVPVLAIAGIGGLAAGKATGSAVLFSIGISLVPIAIAIVATAKGANGRLSWTLAAAFVAGYWLMPWNLSEKLFGTFDNPGGMEMFVLSGIMIVGSLTVIIVYNARLISWIYGGSSLGRKGYLVGVAILGVAAVFTVGAKALGTRGGSIADIGYLVAIILTVAAIFSLVAQRFTGLAPALKMGVAYPLANRFRTGMTIAMFSLILFSITVMSVINASFLQLFAGDDARAGWDVVVTTNRNNPIDDLRAALAEEGSFDANQVDAVGALTSVDDDRQSIRMTGDEDWAKYVVRAGDYAFWESIEAKLDYRATGYDSDRAVFDTVQSGQGFALISATAMATTTAFSDGSFMADVAVANDRFEPFQIEIRNEATGAIETVTVIGALSQRIPIGLFAGLLISESTNTGLFGASEFDVYYVRLVSGVDSVRAARDMKAALVTRGVETFSIEEEIDEGLAISRGFLRLMQAFMALGLMVGIAAVGVVALRSVVERRQQIGMLRAIGYERQTVAWSFLFETAFIALMGVGSGVLGAVILSRNLVTSPEFTGTEGLALFVPWPEIISFSVVAFVFAMLMTWWPSRRAASVPIAEALRYE